MMFNYEKKKAVIGLMLEDIASKIPDRPFLQFQEEKPRTYREVNEIANRIGNNFYELGVRRGDRISIFSPNCLEYIYTWFGVNKIGAAESSVNTAYRGDFLSYTINDSETEVLVIDESLVGEVEKVQNNLRTIKKTIIFSKEGLKKKPNWKFETLDYSELYKGSSRIPATAAEVRHSDCCNITYTSGTTGPSKGVVMSHCFYYTWGTDVRYLLGLSEDDISLTCLPFFHGNPKLMCITPAMLAGSKVVIYPRFSATKFWDWIRKNNVTKTNILGIMAPFLLNQPKRDDDADNPLKACMMIPPASGIAQEFARRFGVKPYSAFGQTETGCIVCYRYDEFDKVPPGSSGKVNTKRYEVKIFDEDDEELPPGKRGEVVFRPRDTYGMMTEFYNKPEKTKESFRNLWFHTGDGGYFDKDGYFFFTDRIKDYIRRRGENISSYEVENVVISHPAVKEAAAIGVKTEYGGMEEEVKVCVVLNEGYELKHEDLMAWCEERMPYYAIPRYVEFMDELPRTPTEKVLKYKLREFGVTEKCWDREKAGYKIKK